MFNFLSSLFQSKPSNQENQLFDRSREVVKEATASSHAQAAKQENNAQPIKNEKKEPILIDAVKQAIDSIDLKSYVQNSKDITLLKLYKFVTASDEFKKLFKQFEKAMNFAIVAGKVKLHDNDELKDHIWMIVGFDRSYSLFYNFIYNQSEKFSDKLIIDLQPLLDDTNNDVLILEYNSHPQYRPYGNETITDVDKYFQSKQHLKNITLYQPKE